MLDIGEMSLGDHGCMSRVETEVRAIVVVEAVEQIAGSRVCSGRLFEEASDAVRGWGKRSSNHDLIGGRGAGGATEGVGRDRRRHAVPVRVQAPGRHARLQRDVAFGPKGVFLGVNPEGWIVPGCASGRADLLASPSIEAL